MSWYSIPRAIAPICGAAQASHRPVGASGLGGASGPGIRLRRLDAALRAELGARRELLLAAVAGERLGRSALRAELGTGGDGLVAGPAGRSGRGRGRGCPGGGGAPR